MHIDISQEPFHVRICKENAGTQDQEKLAPETLRKPAQSKSHKSNFLREFTIYWKKAGDQGAYPDPPPALAPAARTPLGKSMSYIPPIPKLQMQRAPMSTIICPINQFSTNPSEVPQRNR